VALVEWEFLIGLVAWIDTLLGARPLSRVPKWAAVIGYIGLCAANHYPLVSRRHGTRFEREFSNLKTSQKVLLSSAWVAVVVSAVAFLICTAPMHRRLMGID
jgi:hypothetical protein